MIEDKKEEQKKEEQKKEEHKDKHPYNDIINLEHPVSRNREHMSVHDRAAQFSPFAALTGFEGEIKETARLTDHRIELDEAEKSILDEKLRIVKEQIDRLNELELVYFQPDKQKTGGAYISVRGIVKKVDQHERVVIMKDGTRILIKEILDITGEMFQRVDDALG